MTLKFHVHPECEMFVAFVTIPIDPKNVGLPGLLSISLTEIEQNRLLIYGN